MPVWAESEFGGAEVDLRSVPNDAGGCEYKMVPFVLATPLCAPGSPPSSLLLSSALLVSHPFMHTQGPIAIPGADDHLAEVNFNSIL